MVRPFATRLPLQERLYASIFTMVEGGMGGEVGGCHVFSSLKPVLWTWWRLDNAPPVPDTQI